MIIFCSYLLLGLVNTGWYILMRNQKRDYYIQMNRQPIPKRLNYKEIMFIVCTWPVTLGFIAWREYEQKQKRK